LSLLNSIFQNTKKLIDYQKKREGRDKKRFVEILQDILNEINNIVGNHVPFELVDDSSNEPVHVDPECLVYDITTAFNNITNKNFKIKKN